VKNKIIYIFLFLVAFIFTTGAVVFLNSVYKNIFQYDFRMVTDSDTTNVNDSTKTINASITLDHSDSSKTSIPAKVQDSVQTANSNNSIVSDSLKRLQNVIKPSENLASDNKTQDSTHIRVDETSTKPDSSYLVWMKQTAKLYESMDPKKAAKIIRSYSDNIARDIIYSMKQKNAAEILSELDPDTASRITRAKSNAF
jgi:flagellar motility protein MotE (MotC chaperone)